MSPIYNQMRTRVPTVWRYCTLQCTCISTTSSRHACRRESAKNLKKAAREEQTYDGNLFNTDKVQNYMKALDSHCKHCLESLFSSDLAFSARKDQTKSIGHHQSNLLGMFLFELTKKSRVLIYLLYNNWLI